MITANNNYQKLQSSYLFSEIRSRITRFREEHPNTEVISLGIGDVTLPLPEACRTAFHRAIDELGSIDQFRGYGPEQGYEFLRSTIANREYHDRGLAHIVAEDIFVSDGSKCDVGNIQELFSAASIVAITDPVYPVYVDSNVMGGRSGTWNDGRYQGITYLPCTEEHGFTPTIPDQPVDVVYLCSPNNPTGCVLTRQELADWVEYAHRSKSLILFDAAYERFITDPTLPRSIFEIEGAEEVAIEFRSFSKTAGFTGVRCAFTVIPKKCRAFTRTGEHVSLQAMWFRRQSTKFNGVSYPVQRAAEAVYSPEGQTQVQGLIDYYMDNASTLRSQLTDMGFQCYGGEHAPYVWVRSPDDSWRMFDVLLSTCGVVCTPGAGFGTCGEGYVRFSAFNQKERIETALERMRDRLP